MNFHVDGDTSEILMGRRANAPSQIKLTIRKRDKGKCVKFGSTDNLHFGHVIPFLKGGSSLVANSIQLLCVRYNVAKRDRSE